MVDEHHVGCEPAGHGRDRDAGADRADELEAGRAPDRVDDAVPDHQLVRDDEDAFHVPVGLSPGGDSIRTKNAARVDVLPSHRFQAVRRLVRSATVARDSRTEAKVGSQDNELDENPEVLRAIIADDDPFARRTIRDALQRSGIVVIAEAHNGRQAVELCLHYRPHVVLMDVVMPELDGIAATRRIVKEIPGQIVVILTSSDEEEMGMLGLRAGAVGFLTKDLDVDVLPQALRGALEGEAVISRRLGMRLVEQLRTAPQGGRGVRPVKSPLTAREWEVIDLLDEGKTTDQIAEALVVSGETVRSHVKNILRKLEVSSREEAVAEARRMRGGGEEE